MKKLKYFLFVLILVLVIGGIAAYVWYQDAIYSPVSSSDDTVSIEVKDGENVVDATQDLQAQGAFKSVEAFRIYLRLNNLNPSLVKGTYQVPKNLNVPGILEHLGKGPKIVSVKVTLPEAIRYDEIAELINKAYANVPNVAFKKSEFLDICARPDKYKFDKDVQAFIDATKTRGYSLEGYLFPDTYNLGVDASALDVVNLLISTRLTRFDENNIDYKDKGRLNSFYEAMVLASVVEREARGAENMKIVADILMRRVERNEILGADATLLYTLKRWTPGPNSAELQLNTPYNTRKYLGLPPTPIDNPGIDAVLAVLHPTSTQYYYYLTDKDGEMRYAVTYSQHLVNIQKYGVSGESD
jgi:UPF0755 protein